MGKPSGASFFVLNMRLLASTVITIFFSTLTVQSSDSPDSLVVMRFGGDCLLAENYTRATGDSVGIAFAGFDLFATADVAMVNLEGPVTTRGIVAEKPFTFRMGYRVPTVLKEAGVTIVNIANNHIFDYGAEGLYDTVEALDSAGVHHVGAGRTFDEAHHPALLERKGKTIAFLGYYGGSEAPAATSWLPGVAYRALHLIESDIHNAKRNMGANYVVVNFHWGVEKAQYPNDDQITFARAVIDMGADAIVGHHPHVLQGIERHKHGVIAYSLGNLIFGGKNRPTHDTTVLELRFGGEDIKCEVIPVRVDNWRLQQLSGPPADSLLSEVRTLSNIFPKSIFIK